MEKSIYAVVARTNRNEILFPPFSDMVGFKYAGAGVVNDANYFLDRVENCNFALRDIVLILKGVSESDITDFPEIFSEGEYCHIKTGAKRYGSAITIPGTHFMSKDDYLYHMELYQRYEK
jgi:hypothetical protein